mgnify:CR=1 FL=1
MKLKKLDRRMKGFVNFKYVAKLRRRTDSKKFKEMRQWCWEQWGASCEQDIWEEGDNPAWSWGVEDYEFRIYIGSDKEAAWYTLKWA